MTESGTEMPQKLNNKVFIDGLPYDNKGTSGSSGLEEELMQFVAAWKVGRPIRLIKKDGQGFGFLVFHSPHSVDVAVRVLNGRKFLGRTLRVEVPKLKNMAPGVSDDIQDDGKRSYARQVLLSDLAKISQPDIIREILRDVAPQLEQRLESIKMCSQNRKAFLTFISADDVEPAVRFLDGFSMLGRRIVAAPAAAPGSLPYSKTAGRGVPPTRHETVAGASSGDLAKNGLGVDVDNAEENAEDDVPVLPLGVDAPPTRQGAKRTERKVPKEKKTSNITGVTEKYNLLEKGPVEVFVGNLGEEITEEQLRDHFAVCGNIVSCEIIVNKSTSLSTGIARVVFALPAYASYAQKHLHGSRLHGHVIRVDRGEESSAPLASEVLPQDGDEELDEDGYMEHYGVKDKAAYFKGTSLEEKHDGKGGKRSRQKEGDSKKKKTRKEGLGASALANGDDDDDGEEHFHDVDEIDVPTAASLPKRRSAKKQTMKKKKLSK